MDQPGKVANPARGQLNRENEYSSVPVCACVCVGVCVCFHLEPIGPQSYPVIYAVVNPVHVV